MEYVYIVSMYTTGQRWNTAVFKTIAGASKFLKDCGMTKLHSLDESIIQDWKNMSDYSQTAIVMKAIVGN